MAVKKKKKKKWGKITWKRPSDRYSYLKGETMKHCLGVWAEKKRNKLEEDHGN